MKPPKKMATCHPDKPHKALGLCRVCYQQRKYPRVYEEYHARSVEQKERFGNRGGAEDFFLSDIDNFGGYNGE